MLILILYVVEMRHISCWNVPYTTPFKINFHRYLGTQFQVVNNEMMGRREPQSKGSNTIT
jgi:hypothetical protein